MRALAPTVGPPRVDTEIYAATAYTAVRRTEGLKADERHPNRDDKRRFYVRLEWRITCPRGVVELEKSAEIVPPYTYVELDAHKGRGKKTFIAVPPILLSWNGRGPGPGGGTPLPDGTVVHWALCAEFIRVTEAKKGIREKEIDDTETVRGALTVVTRDSVAPQIAMTTPVPGSFVGTATPTLVFSYRDQAPSSGLDLTSVQVVVGGIDVSAAVSVGAGQATYTPTTPWADGLHTVVARIRDRANNLGESISTFGVDTVPASLVVIPADGAVLNVAKPTLTLKYVDPAPSSSLDSSSLVVSLDGTVITSSLVVGDNQATYTPADPLSDGQHLLVAQISDLVGHVSEIRSTFVLDTASPTIALSPATATFLATGTPTFTITISDPAPSAGLDLTSITAILDEADVSASLVFGQARPRTIPQLQSATAYTR
jgi:hypothetical protein